MQNKFGAGRFGVNTRTRAHGRDFFYVSVLLGLCLVFNLTEVKLARADDSNLGNWRDTGLKYPDKSLGACLDATQPGRLIVGTLTELGFSAGTNLYDLTKGTVNNSFSPYTFDVCDPYNSLLFDTQGIQFSQSEPKGQFVKHVPNFNLFATNGSPQMYSRDNNNLWVTYDGGLNWQDRTPPQVNASNQLESVVMSGLDANVLYALVLSRPKEAISTIPFTLYYSKDAGKSWTARYSGQTNISGRHYLYMNAQNSYNKPDFLTLYLDDRQFISTDSGLTFSVLDTSDTYSFEELFQTSSGILSLRQNQEDQQKLALSTDGGKTFAQTLDFPFATGLEGFGRLIQLNGAPDTFLLYNNIGFNGGFLWYSSDGAKTWKKLAPLLSGSTFVTPYLPATIYSENSDTRELYSLDLPDPGPKMSVGVKNNHTPDGYFFQQTQHNLFGVFARYWESHGDTNLLGLPKTEPFREINPSDGKIYLVQYFERARLEYHPEFTGTSNEVEIGLLGRLETAGRTNEAAFKSIAPFASSLTHYYFPQSGHSISFGFLNYWLQHNNLAQFGYPISEEFQEVNPDDGKTYTVQYFERGRFEYHPELAGTGYEVSLGLLGNKWLHDKGWLK